MSQERTIDLGAGASRKPNNRRNVSTSIASRPVSFIDAKGRIWTVEMDLPANTTMTTMLQIAKANISLMNNQNEIHLNDLTILVEPEDKDETFLDDIDRIVIFHKKKLDQIEGR
jgi:hypothetical protein|tara:strand:- start:2005 stop:2346 length:342 start_codon:yes stop_codon:yes gene_type:complete